MPAAENDLPAVTPTFAAWFPMRIAHGRPERTLAIRQFLTDLKVETFLPMTWKQVVENGKAKRKLLPAIDNLIFVHAEEQRLKDIKRHYEPLLPLRFMMWTPLEANLPPRIITITDRDMANFKRVAMAEDDSVMFLGNKDFSQKIGRKVRVTQGLFEGVEGTVYRVKKDRRVVVTIEGVCSVAIAHINPDFLMEI